MLEYYEILLLIGVFIIVGSGVTYISGITGIIGVTGINCTSGTVGDTITAYVGVIIVAFD